ncbi:MAG: hypothetical protein ACHQUC_08605 [Chlamydiales bacterium]
MFNFSAESTALHSPMQDPLHVQYQLMSAEMFEQIVVGNTVVGSTPK